MQTPRSARLAFVLIPFWSWDRIFTWERHLFPASHNKSGSWSHALVLLDPLSAEGHRTKPQWDRYSLHFDILPALICTADQRQWLRHRSSLLTIGLCSLILIDYIVFFLIHPEIVSIDPSYRSLDGPLWHRGECFWALDGHIILGWHLGQVWKQHQQAYSVSNKTWNMDGVCFLSLRVRG